MDDDEYSALMAVNMEAFMDLENRLNGVTETDAVNSLERPRDSDCCNQACQNCVWIVYAEKCRNAVQGVDGTILPSRDELVMNFAPCKLTCSHMVAPDIHYLELEIEKYTLADTLVVESPNSENAVERCFACLQLHGESDASVKDVLRWKLELSLRPPRTLFEELLLHCDSTTPAGAEQSAELKRLLVRGHYQTKYRDVIQATSLDTFDDVPTALEHFGLCRLPLAVLSRAIPSRLPRKYTICTSPSEAPTTAGIIFPLVGSCTAHLAAAVPGSLVRAAVQESAFRLPARGAVLMIGAGTGIAPFLAVTREASAVARQEAVGADETSAAASHQAQRRMVLLAGCRTSSDLPFGDELRAASASGRLELHLAISRPDKPAERAYVQDVLAADAQHFWPLLLADDAHVFVCGGTAMGRSVHDTLLDLAQRVGGYTQSQARTFLQDMRCDGRYVTEYWG
eukprot:TRINITY_DN27416_c0_g1_i1.p1 TRINITY_DN27416_c0_g1~~TRINITY_DN27416_c0_g1_i1.p1  ORF type:complete len:462 (-),score=75.80 TRINITY_DN27416_c0_g1_i1:421-1785(-)